MDKDRPIEEVCALLESLLKDDTNQIIFCTGRVEDYREKTIEQINKILKDSKNIDIDSCLYMRPKGDFRKDFICLLYTSPSPRDLSTSRMPSSA